MTFSYNKSHGFAPTEHKTENESIAPSQLKNNSRIIDDILRASTDNFQIILKN